MHLRMVPRALNYLWFLAPLLCMALAQSPTPQRQSALCLLLFDAGRMDAALKACEAATKESATPQNLYLLARVQSEFNLFTASIDNLRLCTRNNSTFVQCYVALSQVYVRQYLLSENRDAARGLLDQAFNTLREAEKANPKYPPVYYNRGLVLAYQGRLDPAVDSINRSLALKNDAIVRASLADIYVRQAKWDDAIKNYEDAIKLDPKNANLRVKFGSLLLIRGNADQALSHLDQAVILSPGNPEAWLRRGDAYFERKDWQQSGVSYQQVIALSPIRYPDAYVGLGQVLIETKDYPKAKFNFTKAVALEDTNPIFRTWLCRANELVGDTSGAKAQCQEALRLKPNLREAQEILGRLK
jgi:tetratricopeptide (TPR) repeat protein